MSRRKISEQQQQRIRRQHTTRSNRAQRPVADLPEQDDSLGPEFEALVITYYGKQAIVEVATDGVPVQLRCHLRTHLEQIVAGDRVVCRQLISGSTNDAGVIVAVLPRKTILTRPDNHGQLRPVAANVDTMLVVIAPIPEPHANLIDRYLVAAENAGMQAVLVYNKCDRKEASDPLLHNLLARYSALGYLTCAVSAKNGDGVPALRALLDQRTCVLVGQSGVGKSSLINALLPQANTLVGDLSITGDKGTHTTTGARLYHLPTTGDGASHGCVIDSPGIREFSLGNVTPQQVLEGFREFRAFIGHCKFRDCRHQQDPGCALRAALASGTISPERFASYEHIVQGLVAH